jgi:hypothetical protein
MLLLDDFAPVTLDSKKLFDAFYLKYPPIHSDYVFTTMISWFEYAHYEYVFFEEALIIKININDILYFRPPIGRCKKSTFDQLISLAKKEGLGYPLTMVTEDMKQWIMNRYDSFEFVPKPEYDDYVYRSKDLAELAGSEYRKIRNRLNKFTKHNDYQVEDINDENIDEIKQFLKRWCIWKDCEDDPLLIYEKKAVMYSIDHLSQLELSGITLRVNDKIEAISVFEQMNSNTAVVHFEKGSPDYDGIYKVINLETARLIKDHADFINRESDMGNPGLRKAKMSYRPDHMIHVYNMIVQ